MTFMTAGLAVAGAAAVAIPILIHLLWRQRRKPIRWAAMRFLLEAYRKHRRRLRTEQLLLLIVRCLIVALLGFALARPLLEHGGLVDGGGNRTVWLLIDNGLVAGLQDDDARAIDRHREAAQSIVDALDGGDRVGIITAARPAAALVTPPTSDHAAVTRLLDEIQPAASRTDIPAALVALRGAIDEPSDEQVLVYVLSDFRAGSAILDEPLPTFLEGRDDVVLRYSQPATTSVANVAVTSVDPIRSLVLSGATDGSGQLTVRLARHGVDLASARSRVEIRGAGISRAAARTVRWNPGQTEASVDFVLDFDQQQDTESGLTVLIDDDALDADNERHAVLSLRRSVRATVVDRRTFGAGPDIDRLEAGQWITRALEPWEESPIEVVEVEPSALSAPDLRATDVAVLSRPDLLGPDAWETMRRFVDDGGVVIVSPPGDLNVHQWTDEFVDALGMPWSFERETRDYDEGMLLASEQPSSSLLGLIASDIESLAAPVVVRRSLIVDPGDAPAEVLLELADGTPLLIAGAPVREERRGDGLVIFMASAPELGWTNLPSKPLMVPLFQELVRQGLSAVRARRSRLVGDQPAAVPYRAAVSLSGPEGLLVDLDDDRRPFAPVEQSGLYRALDGAARDVGTVAVNIDPAGGRTDVQAGEAVDLWLRKAGDFEGLDDANATAALARAETGAPIGGVLLVIVLALAVLETILARRFSHADRHVASGEGVLTSMVEATR